MSTHLIELEKMNKYNVVKVRVPKGAAVSQAARTSVNVNGQVIDNGNGGAPVVEHDALKGLRNSESYSDKDRYIHLTPEEVKKIKEINKKIDDAIKDLLDGFAKEVVTKKLVAEIAEIGSLSVSGNSVLMDAIAKTISVSGKSSLSDTFAKSLTVSGKSSLYELNVSEVASFVKGWTAGSYAAGGFGSGAALTVDGDGKTSLEVDDLSVRRQAIFRELVIESMRHVGAEIVISPAWMVCSRVEETGNAYRCYFDRGEEKGGRYESEQMFTVGSQARCQIFRGNRQKYYWRLVTAVGDDWVELSKTDRDGDGVPAAGDHIAQLGHRSDKAQQSAIVLSAFGSGAPSLNQYDGINSYSLVDKAVTTLSPHGNRLRGTVIMESGKTAEQAIKEASDEAYNKAKKDLENVHIGDDNLLLQSNMPVEKTGYHMARYGISQSGQMLKKGEKVTVVMKASLGEGKDGFYLYNKYTSGRSIVTLSESEEGVYLKTFDWYKNEEKDDIQCLNVYSYPSSVPGTTKTKIEWIKLIRGNKTSLDWSRSSEEMVTDANISALQEKWNRDLNSAKSEVTEAGKLYADQKAKTAEETAKAHADGKVTEEEQKRIAAEQAQEKRLKNYSDAAKAEAEQKAKAYSDSKVTQVEEALNEALNTKTEQAKTEAIAHADGKVDALEKGKLKQLADKQQEDAAALNAAVNALDTKLQRQIDGMTETWQYPGTPLPAESLTDEAGQGGWTDVARLLSTDTDYYRKWKKDGGTAKEIAERHIDDKYTNISDDGDLRFRSWRFQVNDAGTKFRWLLMPEGEISKALAIAGQAQAKAQEALKAAQDNLEKAKQDAKDKAEAAKQAAIAAANAKTEEERKKLQAAADKAQSAADKANNAVIAAQAAADKAKEIADNKNATFYTQPSNYAVNDSWVLSAAWNGHKAGSILYAKRSNKTFAANDWEERVRYTDDTLASEAVEKAKKAQEDADKVAEQARNLNTRLTEAQQKLAKAQRELDETKAKALENDGRIDEAEQAILDAKQKAIDEARKAYEKAKKDLLDLSIGGRNIVLKSKPVQSYTPNQEEGKFGLIKAVAYTTSAPFVVGKTYAISFVAKGVGILQPHISGTTIMANVVLTPDWKRYTNTFIASLKSNQIHLYGKGVKNIEIQELKIEEGDKATAYTEAPEDIIAEIEQLRTETIASLKVLDDQIKTKVSQTVFDEYGKAVNTKFTQITQTTDAIKTDVSKVSKNAEQMEQRLNTKIEQTAEGINTEVSKKVGKEEVISRINQSAEGIKIQANKVEINGQAIFNEIKDRIVDLSKYQDTRNDNFPPSYYYQNYKQSEVREFKLCDVIGLNTNKDGQYCALHTMTVWGDKSGGKVKQIAYCDTGSIYYRQGMSVDDIWGDWSLQTNEARLAEEFTDEKVNERINRNTTVIDGGRIKTNTIDANKIIANEALVKRLFAIEAFFRDLYVDFAHVTGMLEAEKVKFGNLAGSPLLEIISANLVRIGQLYINAAGEMEARDSNGVQRLVFNSSEIDKVAELGEQSDHDSTNYSSPEVYYENKTKDNIHSFGVYVNGFSLTVSGELKVTYEGGTNGVCVLNVWMEETITKQYYSLGTIRHYGIDGGTKKEQISVVFNNMTSSSFKVYASFQKQGVSSVVTGVVGALSFHSYRKQDRERTHIGRNGVLVFKDKYNYFHCSRNEGLTVKGEMNIPGVLAAGTVDKLGGVSNVWGSKASSRPAVKISSGKYRVYHDIGHQQYSVSVTPSTYYRHGRDWTASASYMDKGPNSFVVFLNEDDGDPVDVNFDFQCFGYNL